jgi:putative transcriptional regulator
MAECDGARRRHGADHQRPVRYEERERAVPATHGEVEMTDIPELTEKQLARAISARMRKRLMLGHFESGEDVAALRRFVGLSQSKFAEAMGISVHTLRNWEQGRRRPEGAAIALLRIAARHPRIIRENLKSAA